MDRNDRNVDRKINREEGKKRERDDGKRQKCE